MADTTQGKAQQRPAGGGPGNPRAIAKGEDRAAGATREAARTPTATAAEPENSVLNPGGKGDNRPTREEIAKRDPKMFRAMERGYVDGRIVEAGEVFSTQMDQGSWMEKVKKGQDYGVEAAVDEAQMARKVDIVYDDLSDAALEVFAAMAGVSKPQELSREEKIEAIRAKREVNAQ